MELQAQLQEDSILLGRGACRTQCYLSTVSGGRVHAGSKRVDGGGEAVPLGFRDLPRTF